MRYLCVYKTRETDAPPDPKTFQGVSQLIEDMTKAGVFISTAGCAPTAKGARVRIDRGEITVTDGPFSETKEVLAGYCLIEVKSKAEAIQWTKRFLDVMGEGESEVRLINEPGDVSCE